MYLRWKKRLLKADYERLMTHCKGKRFYFKRCFQQMVFSTNGENVRQYKIRSFLIVEQILAFATNNNFVKEFKNFSPNFERLA